MPAQLGRQCVAQERGRRTPILPLAVLSAGAFLWILGAWRNVLQVVSAGPVHELLSLGNSLVWPEPNMETTQLSARKELIVESVFDVLEENGIHGLKREEILQLTRQEIEKVMANSYWMPNWALKSLGATVDAERTTESYGGKGWISPLFSSAKPPETLLQPDVSAGSCWAFQGSRGHAVIQLPENIWPTAVTMWHVSKAVSPSGDVSSAPRDFAILGVDEDEGETLLGSFVYDVDGEIAQTFHMQEKPLQSYRQIKLEVQNNWGNAEYTCIYRVEIHGNP
ncbi:SUN domain-containing protein 2-like [Excalfactoria chinensis]|uniref:SUN domain-containing protein 2-like n=1 Tax=Excalfactoria chinensis TaxID=46218 RepID=UPI003B3BD345